MNQQQIAKQLMSIPLSPARAINLLRSPSLWGPQGVHEVILAHLNDLIDTIELVEATNEAAIIQYKGGKLIGWKGDGSKPHWAHQLRGD